jgi:signal transduction histidine kinase
LLSLNSLCPRKKGKEMVVGVRAFIHSMEGKLRRLAGKDVRLVIDDGAACGAVVIDPGLLEQLILNLAIHARDVTPHGGQLSVSARCIEIASEAVEVPGRQEGRFVEFAVTDTGPALASDALDAILDPTVVADASDLGLSVVARIVAHARGFLAVDSSGAGTTFRACIPEASESLAT